MVSDGKKINLASLKVLSTLSCLFEEDLTMKEIVSKLNCLGLGAFNNFVVSKYINTCKSCGVDIQKFENKYTLVNFPVGMKISAEKSKLIYEIKQYSESAELDNLGKIIDKFIKKLHLTFFKADNGLPSSSNYRIIKIFEKACLTNCEVEILFKDNTSYSCLAEEIKVVNNKIVFKTRKGDEEKEINPYDVIDINLSKELKEVKKQEVVVYKLFGKLASRYQLREHEQVIEFKKNGSIVIANKYEDKKELLHRLMRYDVSCKLLKPKSYVNEMKQMLDIAIKNYE